MDYNTALRKASSLCSRQEFCCSEIKKKLENWEVTSSQQEKIISVLIQEKFIDESRFAMAYVRDKFRFNKWGRHKIRWQLKQKAIPDEIINNALTQIEEEEYKQTLTSLIKSKLKQIQNRDIQKQKAALIRNATSKGFEMDVIIPVVEQLLLKK
ncbi:regulatory protein RecX [Thermophagus sp. OGC60D27]|uniref:regulatory protein RecX n=1 Tax=Thermophagus sp. OGC60D27 TaxID=3458415 RepID=UPI0040381E1F